MSVYVLFVVANKRSMSNLYVGHKYIYLRDTLYFILFSFKLIRLNYIDWNSRIAFPIAHRRRAKWKKICLCADTNAYKRIHLV